MAKELPVQSNLISSLPFLPKIKNYISQESDQAVCNNPYNMDLYLAELIPSTAIGSGTGKFRPGTSDDGSVDYVTLIVGGQWKKYWYNSSSTNSAVTSMMIAGSRAGTGGSNALQSSDLFIGSGTVTNLQSCSDAAGSSMVPTTMMETIPKSPFGNRSCNRLYNYSKRFTGLYAQRSWVP